MGSFTGGRVGRVGDKKEHVPKAHEWFQNVIKDWARIARNNADSINLIREIREIRAQKKVLFYTKNPSKIPAAMAEPITPATFGPMACISR